MTFVKDPKTQLIHNCILTQNFPLSGFLGLAVIKRAPYTIFFFLIKKTLKDTVMVYS